MQRRFDETERQIDKTQRHINKTQRHINKLSKNVGGVNNKLGKLTEAMFSARLWEKFSKEGYEFTKQSPNVQFVDKESKRVMAEADFMLEDGIYAMVVEVKVSLNKEDVDDHLKRIEKIRKHMDGRGDNRKLLGAVATGIVKDDAIQYAQKNGLYVFVQSGDSVIVADAPPDFQAREW